MGNKSTTELLKQLSGQGLDALQSLPLLEKITSIVPGIIYVFNQATQSNEYTNHNIGEFLGYSPQEVAQMGDQLMPTLCKPEDLPRILAYFQVLQSMHDHEVKTIEYRVRHKNGNWVWLLSTDTVFERDDSGRVLRHIGVATDITAQKNAETQAREVQEELRDFSYSMSHDLKSPANTLGLLMSELREQHSDSLDNDASYLLSLASQTVLRMQNAIEDVLTYTNVISESPVFQAVSLVDIMDEVIVNLTQEIRHSGAQIHYGALPLVSGHVTQIRMLFQNLISNSIKYSKANVPPVIQVFQSFSEDHNDGWLSVSVQDNGIGIDPRYHESIFRIFSRLHGRGENEPDGVGLGLAICRRVAITHGAEISVCSEKDAGATFTVHFPPA